VHADAQHLYITVSRNCYRCGLEFRTAQRKLICNACRRPKVRPNKPLSKRLTLRENQVVDLLILGKLNKEIAFQLHLSEGTVKTYLSAIFQKTGVTNRTELAVWALTRRESAA